MPTDTPFDHAAALRAITCPTLLLHADSTWDDGHVLNGAMSDYDADKAAGFLRDGTLQRIDAPYVTHLDQPDAFLAVLTEFFAVEARTGDGGRPITTAPSARPWRRS